MFNIQLKQQGNQEKGQRWTKEAQKQRLLELFISFICSASQWTGFYIIGTTVIKEIRTKGVNIAYNVVVAYALIKF